MIKMTLILDENIRKKDRSRVLTYITFVNFAVILRH